MTTQGRGHPLPRDEFVPYQKRENAKEGAGVSGRCPQNAAAALRSAGVAWSQTPSPTLAPTLSQHEARRDPLFPWGGDCTVAGTWAGWLDNPERSGSEGRTDATSLGPGHWDPGTGTRGGAPAAGQTVRARPGPGALGPALPTEADARRPYSHCLPSRPRTTGAEGERERRTSLVPGAAATAGIGFPVRPLRGGGFPAASAARLQREVSPPVRGRRSSKPRETEAPGQRGEEVGRGQAGHTPGPHFVPAGPRCPVPRSGSGTPPEAPGVGVRGAEGFARGGGAPASGQRRTPRCPEPHPHPPAARGAAGCGR